MAGQRHSTTAALSAMLTPEEIKRGGTQHATNAALERYLRPHKAEVRKVRDALKQLRGNVIDIKKKLTNI